MIVASEPGRALNQGVMIEDRAVAELDVVAYDGVGPNLDALSQPGRGRNNCPRIDFTHRAFSTVVAAGAREPCESISTIMHIMVASAASSSFT